MTAETIGPGNAMTDQLTDAEIIAIRCNMPSYSGDHPWSDSLAFARAVIAALAARQPVAPDAVEVLAARLDEWAGSTAGGRILRNRTLHGDATDAAATLRSQARDLAEWKRAYESVQAACMKANEDCGRAEAALAAHRKGKS